MGLPVEAEERDICGPFLRFGSGTGPADGDAWKGSVLFITKGDAAPTLQLADPTGGSGPAAERQVAPTQLDACEGWVFWRFDLDLKLTAWQRSLQYSITVAGGPVTPTYSFWLPALGQPMHWGYYSCSGFSACVGPEAPERQDPTYLWRDLLQLHSAFPLHCLVGGGDQLYSDGVFKDHGSLLLKAWGEGKDHAKKVAAPWTPEMEAEAAHFFLTNYMSCFSVKDVDAAYAQIPQVMMWDDHDIWDGYGSYDPHMQNCPVFKGLFGVARRFYLLFQQHTNDAFNATAKEFLTNDGSELHYIKYMGPQVAVLGLDMRSLRTKARIMPEATYELLDRSVAALPAATQHLVVLSGIPVIFPKIPVAETVLGAISRLSRSSKRFRILARTTGMMDRFDQPEILDDLVDGWVADVHLKERLQFLHLLQKFATTKCLRVSILSGDAHVGGVGRFYSRPKYKVLGDDPLFMPQIISSAIMNAPPPAGIVKTLMRTNWATNVDKHTREKMVRAFYPRHLRTDKLLAQRNWCDISLVAPPFTPPMVPQDPSFGGLRFNIRAEDVDRRRGYAEEIYTIIVPRHPSAGKAAVATGATSGAAGSGTPATTPSGNSSPYCPLNLAPEIELPAQQQRQQQPAGAKSPAAARAAN